MKKIILFFMCISITLAFSLSDDFNTLDQNSWLVYDHGGYHSTPTPPAYDKATVENGVLKLPVDDTDHGPELINKYGFPIDQNSVITAKWRAKVHYVNDYFAGSVTFRLVDYNTSYDPSSVNYNIIPGFYFDEDLNKSVGLGLATVYYRYYFYNDYPKPYGGDTFGLCARGNSYRNNTCLVSDSIWDKWFDTKVVIDIPKKSVKYFINDEFIGTNDLNTTDIDFSKFKYLRIHFSPYGWWTGSEMDLDNFSIDIKSSSSQSTIVQHFEQGWNLVGPAITSDNFDQLFSDKPVSAVWKWDNSAKKWLIWSNDDNLVIQAKEKYDINEAVGAEYLKEGYWVYATSAFDLER